MSQQPAHTCPRCGAPIQPGQPFCAQCALPLDPQSLAAFAAQRAPQVAPVAAPPAPARRSSVAGIAIGIVALIIVVGIGANVARNNRPPPTPAPTQPPLTATAAAAQAQRTGQAVAARATQTTAARPSATLTPDREATYQAESSARATAQTTPVFHRGDTISFKDWTISLAKITTAKTLVWSDFGNAVSPSGRFQLVWVDAKNTQNVSRGIDRDVDWELRDDHDSPYPDLYGGANILSIGGYINRQGRDTLDIGVTPRAVGHYLLVFDVAADAKPVQLILRGQGLFDGDKIVFDLTQK